MKVLLKSAIAELKGKGYKLVAKPGDTLEFSEDDDYDAYNQIIEALGINPKKGNDIIELVVVAYQMHDAKERALKEQSEIMKGMHSLGYGAVYCNTCDCTILLGPESERQLVICPECGVRGAESDFSDVVY